MISLVETRILFFQDRGMSEQGLQDFETFFDFYLGGGSERSLGQGVPNSLGQGVPSSLGQGVRGGLGQWVRGGLGSG
jgi:hypothetical protein